VKLGAITPLSSISFDVASGQVVGLVGESGAGKSMVAKAIVGLLSSHARVSGSIRLLDEELIGASQKRMQQIRGASIGFVFQDALTALDPVYTVEQQMVEVLQVHKKLSRAEARQEAERRLEEVKIKNPRACLDAYPHQLSGGMRQRVVIAIALIADPVLVIGDEPTSALDVTVQRTVLDLLMDVCASRGAWVLMSTHDLGIVGETCDLVVVLCGGMVAETAVTFAIFGRQYQPYSRALLNSILKMGERKPFRPIPGNAIRVLGELNRCPFAPRCSMKIEACLAGRPPERIIGTSLTTCIRAEEVFQYDSVA